ncbi:DUF397 domain-containing protein [Streptomyces sp. ACA25]|uniref:DUF397 domain-containing protein n=1 Tax=Streptomyces sp. ACA25 TaxID=3022596 RepID=UPI0023071323|nr:DUF397 domain-containing protein [Streptomyces sp. ACA25]MDB1088767.1 DUF397 domain-containing protein [Streptomyces sp. ACA25]
MRTSELAWYKSRYSGGDGDNCVEVSVQSSAVFSRCLVGVQRRWWPTHTCDLPVGQRLTLPHRTHHVLLLRATVHTIVPVHVMHQKIAVIDERTVMLGSLNTQDIRLGGGRR